MHTSLKPSKLLFVSTYAMYSHIVLSGAHGLLLVAASHRALAGVMCQACRLKKIMPTNAEFQQMQA